MKAHSKQHGRGRLVLALALFGLAALSIGTYLYFGRAGVGKPAGFGQGAGSHLPKFAGHGDPVDPPLPLPNMALPLLAWGSAGDAPAKARAYTDFEFFRRKWTFLYWGPGTCPERCRVGLAITGQVRSALDRGMDRVQRVFVADGSCCDVEFLRAQQDLITVRAGSDASPLLALLSDADHSNATVADRLYLIDPSGRLVMSYAPTASRQDILADLKILMDSYRADSAEAPRAPAVPAGKSPAGAATPQIED